MSSPLILIIEDNISDIVLLRRALDETGSHYRVDVLPDGEAALQYVSEHRVGRLQPSPCVILLDLHLPKYNGMEVLTAIQQDPVLTHIRVMVLTSLASAREHQEIETRGALCRVKPFTLEDYFALACEILDICSGHTPKAETSTASV